MGWRVTKRALSQVPLQHDYELRDLGMCDDGCHEMRTGTVNAKPKCLWK